MAVSENQIDKPYYELVFVVLVYRNIEVLRQFFASLALSCNYRVIVVNSFCNQETEDACQALAAEKGADYISVPNKGFGAGNNTGCQYAIDHYQFRFLILSNSDVEIIDISRLHQMTDIRAVYAPDIVMKNGHHQNPNIPIKLYLYIKLLDLSYKYKIELLKTIALAINRLCREIFVVYLWLLRKNKIRIFSGHGSFVVITYRAVLDLSPVFLEEMFLYNEELYLGYRCRMKMIPIYYVPTLKVLHQEGASSTKQSNAWKNHEDSYRVLTSWLRENRLT
jgi:GT2 family glycosyltransferase